MTNKPFDTRIDPDTWGEVGWKSLAQVLRMRAQETPDEMVFTFLVDGEEEGDWLTYAALDRQARSIAAWLQERGLRGERVLLPYPPGLDFVRGFMGCLYAGAVAVPMYPPRRQRQDERLMLITDDARPAAVFCVQENFDSLVEYLQGKAEVLATDTMPDLSEQWQEPGWSRDDLAFIQYTSGSTGNPRGVMVGNGNVVHNAWYLSVLSRTPNRPAHVSWQPFFHDMGLIGSLVWPIYDGVPIYMMAPAAFLQKPIRFLRAMSKYKATGVTTPNFGEQLCISGTTPEEREGLDLSHMERLWNGAEPIRASTLLEFTETFSPYGFRHEAHLPCYGMAETTLCVTAGEPGSGPTLLAVRSDALEQHKVVVVEAPSEDAPLRPASGLAKGEMDVRVVDPDTCLPCAAGTTGEIWLAGPSVAQGYWERPKETEVAFNAHLADTGAGPFLRTGDLGFVHAEELVVTGRLKDLIIIRGRNIYPQDVERGVEVCHPAVEADTCAAFSIETDGHEAIGIVVELRRAQRRTADKDEVLSAIRSAVTESCEVAPSWIGLLKPHRTPKTSSGKIRHAACAEMYAQGVFDTLAEWKAPPAARPLGGEQIHLNDTLRGCAPAERKRRIVTYLQQELAATLGLSSPPSAALDFGSIGVDSMLAVELVKRLEAWLGDGVELPATLLFDQPNIEAIATYIEQLHTASHRPAAAEAVRSGATTDEPVAIVGMACRFPGAPDLDAYWELLRDGRDAIGDVPPDRWDAMAYFDPDPQAAGKMYTRSGGFVDGYDRFDAAFFDISPREALSIDPQQRFVLELAWTALEHAGIAPGGLAGSPTGVYLGVSTGDYRQLLLGQGADRDESMLATGTAQCGVAGRLSYALGLEGPCTVIDTACSSSIVAVHQAMQALRLGECSHAIAGGVNLVLSPDVTVSFCRAGMLSPDGRCKTFDAAADGYGRGEGCGIIVLKRLSDAQRDGDRILAVLRGSAVNQDGHTSGLTAPSGPSQTAVIRAALQAAHVQPAEVQVLECHGTGTPLGDPIEVQAADAAYSQGRDVSAPLLIGSAKTNLGHLEAAAGMAGLFKIVLALRNREVPASLHFETPNPHIRWDRHAVRVASRLTPWPEPPTGHPRRAGLSSFGFVGTNAHLIVEESPTAPEPEAAGTPENRLLALSARSEEALHHVARDYAAWLDAHQEMSHAALCYSHNMGRNQFAHRATVVCSSTEQLREQLAAVAEGSNAQGVTTGSVGTSGRRIGFLFTGQGAQYAGMGRELYEAEPTFRACIDACTAAYAELHDAPPSPTLRELLFNEESADLLKQTLYAQPAIYALQVALVAQWKAWGIEPTAFVGHSLGEYAAAYGAGAFSAADGMKLVLKRAQLMEEMPAGGAMASVTAPPEDVEAALANEEQVCISAYNGLNTVISGPANRLEALLERLAADGVYCMKLPASNAFHSAFVDPIGDAFGTFAATLDHRPVQAGLISTLTGEPVPEGTVLDATHWRTHAREPVRFAQGVKSLFEDAGCDIVVEIGPKAELMWLAQMCWRPEHDVVWTSSLEAGRQAHAQMLSTAGQLHAIGADVDLAGLEQPWAARQQRVQLPTYPFERKSYWPEITASWAAGAPANEYFEVGWVPTMLASETSAARSWLLLGDENSLPLADGLQKQGHSVTIRLAAELASTDVEAIRQQLAEFLAEGITDVLLAWTPPLADDADVGALQQTQLLGVETALIVSQALIARGGEGRLWILTRAAQPVLPEDTVDPGQGPLWGYARTFGLEHPDRFGAVIDTASGPLDVASAQQVCAAVATTEPGLQLALRDGEWSQPQLQPAVAPPDEETTLSADASYLITGGTGALGVDIARHLADRGAGHVVLASRRGEAATPEGLAEELAKTGCKLSVMKADAADPTDIEGLLDRICELAPLRGIVHAAGLLEGEPSASMEIALLRKVMAGKALGAWALHRATQARGIELDFLVLFSSAAALLGIRDHSNYSAANAFLDGLAQYRRGLGLPATSINWGPWASHGMATQLDEADWQAMGSRLMPPALAMRAFGKLVASGAAQTCVQQLDSARWRELGDSGLLPPVLLRFMEAISASAPQPTPTVTEAVPAGDGPLVETLRPLGPDGRGRGMEQALREQVGKVLGLAPEDINPDMGFFDAGMNSIMAVELSNRIQKQLGGALKIKPADIFNHPTINRLGAFLLEGLFSATPTAAAPAAPVPEELAALAGVELGTAFDSAFGTVGVDSSALDDERMRAALSELIRLKGELSRAQRHAQDPIAIVGMGCRIPGANSPGDFWKILDEGLDLISEVPAERWSLQELYDPDPDEPGKVSSRHGGFLEGIDLFDADFFGISPREAKSLDPQQRMVLEVTWHALENANIAPDTLRGTLGAVFLGIGVADYADRVAGQGHEHMDAYAGTGNALCAAAGRVAFKLGWFGPALAIDTACSSSLVAIHEACKALNTGDCDHAIAGGVNMLLSPDVVVTLSRAHMLAPDGRCKAFDASGNGFVRSEGCALVVLKRLEDARRDGNRVLAVIRGSAVNQDGDSSGLTVPNGVAQEQVMRAALARAGVTPAEVQVLECHGTGTSLGDPIEVQAVDAVYSEGRDAQHPLILGSVKTNVGHLETAAGATGLLKVVLAMQHGVVPQSLHFKEPNPHIPWDDLKVKVAGTQLPWPEGEQRLAGISSFGFVGTNAHLVVSDAPAADIPDPADQLPAERDRQLLALSARTAPALRDLAAAYHGWLETHEAALLPDLCYTANTSRSRLEVRAALAFDSRDALANQLAALAADGDTLGLTVGDIGRSGRKPRIAFLCTGQGAQYLGMGRKLYGTEQLFRKTIDHCAAAFDAVRGESRPIPLRQVMGIEPPPTDMDEGLLNQTEYTQPALFAVEVALAALWRSWGVEPDVVLGHSLGEFAAAVVAGVFDLETGMQLIAERSRLMQTVPSGGKMAAVSGKAEAVEEAIAGDERICIGAYNGANTVLSGTEEVIDEYVEKLTAAGLRCKKLNTSHAFHSVQMEPIVEPFAQYAAQFSFSHASTRLISNVTGGIIAEDHVLDADYWAGHIRQPVRFAQGVQALRAHGCDVMLELGPHPVLTAMGQRCWDSGDDEDAHEPTWVGSLVRGGDDTEATLAAIAKLFTAGVAVDFAAVDAPWHAARTKLDLPVYPFQRKSYWVDEPNAPDSSPATLEACTYHTVWEEHAPAVGGKPEAWLLIGGRSAEELRDELETAGGTCLVVATAADAASADLTAWTRIAHLTAVDMPAATTLDELKKTQQSGLHDLLALAQQLVAADWQGKLWVVTRGTQATADADAVVPDHAPIWGLGKSIGMERPELWGGLLDLPICTPAAGDDALMVRALLADDSEDLLAIRNGKLLAARLDRQPLENPPQPLAVAAEATYLITGGLGGVGLKVAQRFAERGAGRIVLTSRRQPEGAALETIAAIEAAGCAVDVVSADISDAAQVEALVAELAGNAKLLRGVVHAAGVESIGALAEITSDELERTLAAKVYGSWLLDDALRRHELSPDFFVCTASIASVWGSVMQGAYAAANAYLDALAASRCHAGLAATALSYGPWDEVGMGMANAEALEWMRSRGMRPLPPTFAVDGLETVAAAGLQQATVVNTNWAVFRELAEVQRPKPLFMRLGAPASDDVTEADGEPVLVTKLRGAKPREQGQILRDAIRQQLSKVLGRASSELKDDTGFFDLGMDSLMAVEFRNAINKQIGRKLSATVVMDHPDIESLTRFVLADVLELTETDAEPEPPTREDAMEQSVQKLSSEELSAALEDELKEVLGEA